MAPRNNDANASYKKKNFPVEDKEVDITNVVPSLLHKKHKVVRLIKSQLQQIHDEGLICASLRSDAEVCSSEEELGNQKLLRVSGKEGTSREVRSASLSEREADSSLGNGGGTCLCVYLLGFLLLFLILLFLMVWVSAGPLSNSAAHTPISPSSFVRTDSLCTLEKKYLLRWSKPEYYE